LNVWQERQFIVLHGYWKATGLPLCPLINFGKSRLEIKRVAHGLWTTSYHLRNLRISASYLRINLFLPDTADGLGVETGIRRATASPN
jgi:hypothetical protein